MARRLRASKSGEPGVGLPRTNWPAQRKPMRSLRSIRTLMKRDESKGITMPEFKNLLMRAGVGRRKGGAAVLRQTPEMPPGTGTGQKTIRKAPEGPLTRRSPIE